MGNSFDQAPLGVKADQSFGVGGLGGQLHNRAMPKNLLRRGRSVKLVPDAESGGYVSAGMSRSRDVAVTALVLLTYSERGKLLGEMGILPPYGDVKDVTAMVTDRAGAILVAGTNHDESSFLVRTFPGRKTIDANFGSNFRNWLDNVHGRGQVVEVRALLPLQNGKLIVAGSVFKRLGLRTRGPFVVRMNADGTIDDTFRKYGGPPSQDLEFQMVFSDLGHLSEREDVVVAVGRGFTLDQYSIGTVVYLLPDGTPLNSDDSDKWSYRFSDITCCARDTLTGGLALGGRQQSTSGISNACVSRILPNGRGDESLSGGGLWISGSGGAGIEALRTTRSGSIVAVGHDGGKPAIFLCNPYVEAGMGFGPAETFITSGLRSRATGVCVAGSRVVLNIDTSGQGFIISGFKLDMAHPKQPATRFTAAPMPPRKPDSSTVGGGHSAAESSQAKIESMVRTAKAVDAGEKWITQSTQNMATSSFLMGVHMRNLGTQRF